MSGEITAQIRQVDYFYEGTRIASARAELNNRSSLLTDADYRWVLDIDCDYVPITVLPSDADARDIVIRDLIMQHVKLLKVENEARAERERWVEQVVVPPYE